MVTLERRGCAERVARVDRSLAELRGGREDLTPQQRAVHLTGLLAERANLTGVDADAEAAEDVAVAALAAGSRHPDLICTLARLQVDAHDIDRAAATLALVHADLRDDRFVLIGAGIARQRGDLGAAAAGYRRLARGASRWQPLAGLAGVHADRGDVGAADRLYARAADDVDALHLGAFAWIEVQRAQLWLRQHDLERADAHITRAEFTFADWRACELRARWLAQSGDTLAAVAAYRALVAGTRRPDHLHALADTLRVGGHHDEAETCYRAAHAGYLGARSAARYRHHLAEFHLRVRHDPAEALRYAELDHAQRPNRHTAELLAVARAALTG
jgi:tetratricopeptide (TPR) repeat protein